VSESPTEFAERERLKKVRRAEVEAVKPWFEPGTRALELGSGNGYQASIIASWGCEVVAIDVHDSPLAARYYPIQYYDGENIPYPDESFDVVFSCHVLPHVKDLPSVVR